MKRCITDDFSLERLTWNKFHLYFLQWHFKSFHLWALISTSLACLAHVNFIHSNTPWDPGIWVLGSILESLLRTKAVCAAGLSIQQNVFGIVLVAVYDPSVIDVFILAAGATHLSGVFGQSATVCTPVPGWIAELGQQNGRLPAACIPLRQEQGAEASDSKDVPCVYGPDVKARVLQFWEKLHSSTVRKW